jgi:two-component system phosphate regulon response regulator OmpR
LQLTQKINKKPVSNPAVPTIFSSKMKNILIIDDDTRLRNLLGKFLQENNFFTSLAKDTNEAMEILKNSHFDLLIVDVMMPHQDGIDFTFDFRKLSKTPILILTARGEPDDRIKGLEAGADDYLAKPFEPRELLLRINNILKRDVANIDKQRSQDICQFGDFSFNLKDSRLKKADDFIHITDGEARILTVLCNKKNENVPRGTFVSLCGEIDERSVDVQITRLRKKIENNPKQPIYLQTVRNKGYILYTN